MFITDLRISKKFWLFFLVLAGLAIGHAAPYMSDASEIRRTTDGKAEKLAADSAVKAASAKRSLGLQTELPDNVENPRPRDYSPRIRRTPLFGSGEFLINFSRVLLFCSIAAIISIIVFNIKNNLWSYSRTKKLVLVNDGKVSGKDAASRMEYAETEADDLAREGSFTEAMHILLLQSVREMKNRMPNPIAVSSTSRELLRNLDLSPGEREVFATIVGSVEVSYFGGYESGESEYLACRRSFDALTELLRGHS